jgi:hypothetical protein
MERDYEESIALHTGVVESPLGNSIRSFFETPVKKNLLIRLFLTEAGKEKRGYPSLESVDGKRAFNIDKSRLGLEHQSSWVGNHSNCFVPHKRKVYEWSVRAGKFGREVDESESSYRVRRSACRARMRKKRGGEAVMRSPCRLSPWRPAIVRFDNLSHRML